MGPGAGLNILEKGSLAAGIQTLHHLAYSVVSKLNMLFVLVMGQEAVVRRTGL